MELNNMYAYKWSHVRLSINGAQLVGRRARKMERGTWGVHNNGGGLWGVGRRNWNRRPTFNQKTNNN